mmetsp:Transcript_2719/g.9906  ORF Transcript_2719/g.9906 Transcript_2719/m.9906 type:complete len:265 (+) Transcript_2719:81-875(+)
MSKLSERLRVPKAFAPSCFAFSTTCAYGRYGRRSLSWCASEEPGAASASVAVAASARTANGTATRRGAWPGASTTAPSRLAAARSDSGPTPAGTVTVTTALSHGFPSNARVCANVGSFAVAAAAASSSSDGSGGGAGLGPIIGEGSFFPLAKRAEPLALEEEAEAEEVARAVEGCAADEARSCDDACACSAYAEGGRSANAGSSSPSSASSSSEIIGFCALRMNCDKIFSPMYLRLGSLNFSSRLSWFFFATCPSAISTSACLS